MHIDFMFVILIANRMDDFNRVGNDASKRIVCLSYSIPSTFYFVLWSQIPDAIAVHLVRKM